MPQTHYEELISFFSSKREEEEQQQKKLIANFREIKNSLSRFLNCNPKNIQINHIKFNDANYSAFLILHLVVINRSDEPEESEEIVIQLNGQYLGTQNLVFNELTFDFSSRDQINEFILQFVKEQYKPKSIRLNVEV